MKELYPESTILCSECKTTGVLNDNPCKVCDGKALNHHEFRLLQWVWYSEDGIGQVTANCNDGNGKPEIFVKKCFPPGKDGRTTFESESKIIVEPCKLRPVDIEKRIVLSDGQTFGI